MIGRRAAWRTLLWLCIAAIVSFDAFAAWTWLDRSLASPLHQARECRVAAEMARSIIQSVEKTTRSKFPSRAGFNPLLSETISEEAEQVALRHVPARLKSIFVKLAPLDCSDEFKRANIPIVIWPCEGGPQERCDWRKYRAQTTFSRVIFDGQYAYTDMDMVSGPLAGMGHETRWVQKNGCWMLERMTPTWIS